MIKIQLKIIKKKSLICYGVVFDFFFLFENTQPSGQQTSKMILAAKHPLKNNELEKETVHSLSAAWWVLVLQYFFSTEKTPG